MLMRHGLSARHVLVCGLLSLAGCDQIATQLGVGPAFVILDDAHGVQIGDPVRVHGVTVGRVTEVGLVPEGARVAFELANREALHADACGEVRREGLGGEAYVHLDAGRSEEPWAGTFIGCETPSMDDTLAETAGLLTDLRRYVAALERGEQSLCTVNAAAPSAAAEAVVPSEPAPAPAAQPTPETMPDPTTPASDSPTPSADPSPAPASE